MRGFALSIEGHAKWGLMVYPAVDLGGGLKIKIIGVVLLQFDDLGRARWWVLMRTGGFSIGHLIGAVYFSDSR